MKQLVLSAVWTGECVSATICRWGVKQGSSSKTQRCSNLSRPAFKHQFTVKKQNKKNRIHLEVLWHFCREAPASKQLWSDKRSRNSTNLELQSDWRLHVEENPGFRNYFHFLLLFTNILQDFWRIKIKSTSWMLNLPRFTRASARLWTDNKREKVAECNSVRFPAHSSSSGGTADSPYDQVRMNF